MSFQAVTYWAGEAYRRWALSLEASAKEHGVPIVVRAGLDTGNWQANTLQKPEVLLEALEEFGCDVVWVDADCTFLQYPELFNQLDGFEVSIFTEAPQLGSINGSVSLFRNSPYGRDVLARWARRNVEKPHAADDHNLLEVLYEKGMQRVHCLPPSYCWNERLMRHRFPTARPVIEMHLTHMLANK